MTGMVISGSYVPGDKEDEKSDSGTLLSVAQPPDGGWAFGRPSPEQTIPVPAPDEPAPDTSPEPIREPRSLHTLQLTKVELIHLRDILSVQLPPTLVKTVSQALAEKENHVLSEANLWKKVVELCEDADVPIGDEAPDFIVAPTGIPEMRVFEISSEPIDQEDDGQAIDPFNSKQGKDD